MFQKEPTGSESLVLAYNFDGSELGPTGTSVGELGRVGHALSDIYLNCFVYTPTQQEQAGQQSQLLKPEARYE